MITFKVNDFTIEFFFYSTITLKYRYNHFIRYFVESYLVFYNKKVYITQPKKHVVTPAKMLLYFICSYYIQNKA